MADERELLALLDRQRAEVDRIMREHGLEGEAVRSALEAAYLAGCQDTARRASR